MANSALEGKTYKLSTEIIKLLQSTNNPAFNGLITKGSISYSNLKKYKNKIGKLTNDEKEDWGGGLFIGWIEDTLKAERGQVYQSNKAKELAGQAYSSSWALNDDEGSLYAVLQEAGSPDNLSTIAKAYQIRYKTSMGEMYGNALNDLEEVKRVKDILMSYPA
jgi:hypothetical protein